MRLRCRAKFDWAPWFAWRPVSIDYPDGTALVWLEWVERKWSDGVTFNSNYWDYRLRGDEVA